MNNASRWRVLHTASLPPLRTPLPPYHHQGGPPLELSHGPPPLIGLHRHERFYFGNTAYNVVGLKKEKQEGVFAEGSAFRYNRCYIQYVSVLYPNVEFHLFLCQTPTAR